MVSDSPFVTRSSIFCDQLYQGQQSAISVSKELGDGITKRPLCLLEPDYVKTFFSLRQRHLFGPIRKVSSWLADIYTAVKTPQWAQYQSCKDMCWVVANFWRYFSNLDSERFGEVWLPPLIKHWSRSRFLDTQVSLAPTHVSKLVGK